MGEAAGGGTGEKEEGRVTSGCFNGALFPRPWSQEPGTGKGSKERVLVCAVSESTCLNQRTTRPAPRKLGVQVLWSMRGQ